MEFKKNEKSFLDGIMASHGGLEEGIEVVRQRTDADPVNARLDLQVLLNAVGREEEAFEVSNQLLKQAPNDPRVLFNRGWHLLKRGREVEGWELLEHGRRMNAYGQPPIGSSRPLWSKELAKPGQYVLLTGEGGLGDEIINVRFTRELARDYGARIIVSCQPALAPVFARIPWIASVVQKEAVLGVYHDLWMPMMSAPRMLGASYANLDGSPYLAADPAREKAWKGICSSQGAGAKMKIGIRWGGNPQFEHQQLRKFSPEILTSLSALPNVQLFSFQRDHDLVELPSSIVDLGPMLRDWDDTVAALKQMDLVITSCTSVAHMSGALGVPTWVIVPVMHYYIWSAPGESSPWYESVRLFRQARYGEWNDVGERLRSALAVSIREKP